jgi:hypothetical protein
MTLVYAFGVGFVAIGVLLLGLLGMLEGADRRAFLNLLRHPLRATFGEEPTSDRDLRS